MQRPATLEDMLAARENRAKKTAELIALYGSPVIVLSMNMIGDIKTTPLSRCVFSLFVNVILQTVPIKHHMTQFAFTGDEAFFVCDTDAKNAKIATTAIEDGTAVGRLLDIDVIDIDGNKLTRDSNEKRRCIICGNAAMECARSRAHGVEAVREKAANTFCDYIANRIEECAYNALIAEVETTPKPGLVDKNDNGAHTDMDIDTFYRSASAIRHCFYEIAYTVMQNPEMSTDKLMDILREFGKTAERDMFSVTNGVNTHKGAIFSLGLLCAGIAHVICTKSDNIANALSFAAKLARHNTVGSGETNGERVYREYGTNGARGEAVNGFKTVVYGVERLEHYMTSLNDINRASVFALIDIISVLVDTNVLHRAGKSGLEFVQSSAKTIGALSLDIRLAEVNRLNTQLIERNISPGGSADTLCSALFLRSISLLFTQISGNNGSMTVDINEKSDSI